MGFVDRRSQRDPGHLRRARPLHAAAHTNAIAYAIGYINPNTRAYRYRDYSIYHDTCCHQDASAASAERHADTLRYLLHRCAG